MARLHFSDRGEYVVATRDEGLAAWLVQRYQPLGPDAAERVVERLLLNGEPRAVRRLWQLSEGDEPPPSHARDRRERLRRVVVGSRAHMSCPYGQASCSGRLRERCDVGRRSRRADESGYARLEGVPSYPMRGELPDFDPEIWR